VYEKKTTSPESSQIVLCVQATYSSTECDVLAMPRVAWLFAGAGILTGQGGTVGGEARGVEGWHPERKLHDPVPGVARRVALRAEIGQHIIRVVTFILIHDLMSS